MAGPAPVVEKPKLGRGATIAGLIFALLVLTGFSAGTAASYRDSVFESHSGDDHADEEHADDHSDEEHADEEHADDHSDEEHADG